MIADDREYYRCRAEVEAERARRASQPAAVHVHRRLAEAYQARLATLDRIGEPA